MQKFRIQNSWDPLFDSFSSSLISILECHFQIAFLSPAPRLAGGQNTLHSGSWRGKRPGRSFWRHVAVLELKIQQRGKENAELCMGISE